MTVRSRDVARETVLKCTAEFNHVDVPVISTLELRERLQHGEDVVLVDVRTEEERQVSMLPGALAQDAFEAEVLPSLLPGKEGSAGREAPLVVPYSTVGRRSGLYCRKLVGNHGLQRVRNGEGVVMWTFDGGGLAKPGAAGPPLRAPALEEPGAGARELHVYGRRWDIAAEGYATVYFTRADCLMRSVKDLWKDCGDAAYRIGVWVWVFGLFYLFFTPACGLMYECGCQLALSKWGQVETCNIFDHGTQHLHRCPWCMCSGLPCALVSSDQKAFRGVFLLDLLPDGCCLTVLTVVANLYAGRLIERVASRKAARPELTLVARVAFALVWFVAYCLVVGALFFLSSPEYPVFLGIRRQG